MSCEKCQKKNTIDPFGSNLPYILTVYYNTVYYTIVYYNILQNTIKQ